MKVADIMTKNVITVRPDTPVGDVARVFRQHSLSGLPVVNEEGYLVGVITERDMITRHARPHLPAYLPVLGAYIPLGRKEYRESLRRITGVVAQDIMTTPAPTIAADAEIEDLATLMVEEDAQSRAGRRRERPHGWHRLSYRHPAGVRRRGSEARRVARRRRRAKAPGEIASFSSTSEVFPRPRRSVCIPSTPPTDFPAPAPA